MSIDIEITGIRMNPNPSNPNRPVFIHLDCRMVVNGDTFDGTWPECMDEIGRRFPGIEFTGNWVDGMYRMVEAGNTPVMVVDEDCPLFYVEV